METANFYGTLLALFVFYAKPGPGYLMEVSRLISSGLPVAVAIGMGAIVTNSAMIWIGGLGLASISNPLTLGLLQGAALLYLFLYVSVAIWQELKRREVPQTKLNERATLSGWFAFGLVNALINPLNVSFYTAILPAFLVGQDKVGVLIFFNIAALGFLILARLLYYGFAISFRRIMSRASVWKAISISAHLIFLITMLFSAMPTVMSLLRAA